MDHDALLDDPLDDIIRELLMERTEGLEAPRVAAFIDGWGSLLRLLERTQPGSLVSWRAKWLLNVAAMALDDWPAGVPAAHRLPDPPGEPWVGRFLNVAGQSGLEDHLLVGGSVALEDFDGDGDLDLVLCGWTPRERMRFYRNDGRGRFRRHLIARFPFELVTTDVADLTGDGKADVVTGAMNLASPSEIVSRVTLWVQR